MNWMNSFCGMVDQRKAFTPYFQPGSLSETLNIAILPHFASSVWIWVFVEWICAGVMTTTPRHQKMSFLKLHKNSSIPQKRHNFCLLLALTKYKLLRCWSYSWKSLIESLKSIKKKKNLWEDKFCYYKILNTEHLTNQIGLFDLPKIS